MNHQMVILMFTKVTVLFLSTVVIIAHMVHRFLPGHLHWNLHHHMVTPRVPRPMSLLSKTVAHKGAAIWPGISNSAPTWRYPPSKSQHWWNLAANCDAVSCNWNQLDTGKKKWKTMEKDAHLQILLGTKFDAVSMLDWLLFDCCSSAGVRGSVYGSIWHLVLSLHLEILEDRASKAIAGL